MPDYKILLSLLWSGTFSLAASAGITLTPIGGYETGLEDEDAAEIVAHDAATQKLFVVNGATDGIDVLDISDPTSPLLVHEIDLSPYGAAANSVDVCGGVLAAAVEADPKQDPGSVVFLSASDYSLVNQLTVGALPDMLVFSEDCGYLLTANEGEPNDDYDNDPEGSVSIIRIGSADISTLTQGNVATAEFGPWTRWVNKRSIRVFGPGASPAQDFEPEYLAIYDAARKGHGWRNRHHHRPSLKAMVTLQENNAVAIVDIRRARIEKVVGLGFKDHGKAVNAIDASNEDEGIAIRSWPVQGMYLPDAIAGYVAGGRPWFLIANEGDAREYDGFEEEARVGDDGIVLDPARFPDAAALKLDANLGRLKITTTLGDRDGDGDYDSLFSFGGRSFSVLDRNGRMVWDSNSQFEFLTASILPDSFNGQGLPDSFDSRSDDKGAEPEGVITAPLNGREYAFIGLERVGGIMVYDVSDPRNPFFVSYTSTGESHGDIAPEGLKFIAPEDSPNGKPLLVVGFEFSGSTRIFEISE